MNPDDTMDMDQGAQHEADASDPGSFFVDRIEGDKAVVLMGDKAVNIPLSALPKGVQEGEYYDGAGNLVSGNADGEANEMRGQLAAGDDGADIDLDGGMTPDEEMAANVGDADGPDDATGVSPAMLRKIRGLNGAEPMPNDPLEPGPDTADNRLYMRRKGTDYDEDMQYDEDARNAREDAVRVKGVPNMSKVRM